eukprot:6175342-Pleurochrysis_carterae.AAC.2
MMPLLTHAGANRLRHHADIYAMRLCAIPRFISTLCCVLLTCARMLGAPAQVSTTTAPLSQPRGKFKASRVSARAGLPTCISRIACSHARMQLSGASEPVRPRSLQAPP